MDKIKEYIDSLEIIDTHEHLPTKEERRPKGDVLAEYFSHYSSTDLVSAGLSAQSLAQIRGNQLSLTEKWKLLEPYWKFAKRTGYGRALEVSVNDLYDLPGISADTYEELNRRFCAAREQGNSYQQVLKEKSKIRLSLTDGDLDCDKTFFRSVFRADHYACPSRKSDIIRKNEYTGHRVNSFVDYLDFVRAKIKDFAQMGGAALKIGLAYCRTLYMERATYQDAEECFNRMLSAYDEWDSGIPGRTKKFGDYMMHFIIGEVSKLNLPIQIHTGFQEGNGNILQNTKPTHLNNLFLEYPDTTFNLMHMSYPYYMEVGALAKMFPNVNLDLCWAYIISPPCAMRALDEWLELLPYNKIAAFGGDYLFVDGVYGHQKMARETVAKVLAKKIQEGLFDFDEAKEVAQHLFINNPIRMFKLEHLEL